MFVKAVLLMLIKVASLPLSWLPDHTPIGWPDLTFLHLIWDVFSVISAWIDWPVLITGLTLVLGIEAALMLYAAWRAILGLIPGLK